jgi:hypothetical protein
MFDFQDGFNAVPYSQLFNKTTISGLTGGDPISSFALALTLPTS